MIRDPAPPALAKETRDLLTVAHGRLQRLRRKTDRGEVDCAAFLVELDDACRCIRRAAALVDALEAAAAAFRPLAASPPAPRHPDD